MGRPLRLRRVSQSQHNDGSPTTKLRCSYWFFYFAQHMGACCNIRANVKGQRAITKDSAGDSLQVTFHHHFCHCLQSVRTGHNSFKRRVNGYIYMVPFAATGVRRHHNLFVGPFPRLNSGYVARQLVVSNVWRYTTYLRRFHTITQVAEPFVLGKRRVSVPFFHRVGLVSLKASVTIFFAQGELVTG